MNALPSILPLLGAFVHCFTAPGFVHFTHFVLAHMALLGIPHCVTETLRLTQCHHGRHWTTPYAFLRRGRWSCQLVSHSVDNTPTTDETSPASPSTSDETAWVSSYAGKEIRRRIL
jgi:hypothetical protein